MDGYFWMHGLDGWMVDASEHITNCFQVSEMDAYYWMHGLDGWMDGWILLDAWVGWIDGWMDV